MSLYCKDGGLADITPWVPMPPLKPREYRPAEPERDRCKRCGAVAAQHASDPPTITDALDRAIYAAAFVAAMGNRATGDENAATAACWVADDTVRAHRQARGRR